MLFKQDRKQWRHEKKVRGRQSRKQLILVRVGVRGWGGLSDEGASELSMEGELMSLGI